MEAVAFTSGGGQLDSRLTHPTGLGCLALRRLDRVHLLGCQPEFLWRVGCWPTCVLGIG